jgi:hypothetical protein
MNSVSREPQLPQRHFICTSGMSPLTGCDQRVEIGVFGVLAGLAPDVTR